jgi:hypothetical protein
MSFSFPAGTALVEQDLSCNGDSPGKSNSKTSNRMPGNIVCGICGAVRYYAFILQAKKFGTFSCEPCRKFISKTIKTFKESGGGGQSEDLVVTCVSGTGERSSYSEKAG